MGRFFYSSLITPFLALPSILEERSLNGEICTIASGSETTQEEEPSPGNPFRG